MSIVTRLCLSFRSKSAIIPLGRDAPLADEMTLRAIAHVRSDFSSKFGIPRQSGVVPELEADIVFTPEFRNPDTLRGLEDCSHIWLIWQFSGNLREGWQPTVRPPRLGGNERRGVFATRSPFRPNPLGLSCVRLAGIDLHTPDGPVLHILGADLMDGTPVFDIKPYAPYTDCIPDASGGIARAGWEREVEVQCSDELLAVLPEGKRAAALAVLAEDPRPAYQSAPDRVYGMTFAGYDIRFSVAGGVLTVREIVPAPAAHNTKEA